MPVPDFTSAATATAVGRSHSQVDAGVRSSHSHHVQLNLQSALM